MNEPLLRDLQAAMDWIEAHPSRDDDEVRAHLLHLMNWIQVLKLQLQQKQERALWEL